MQNERRASSIKEILLLLALLCVFAALALLAAGFDADGGTAVVYVDGSAVARLPLEKDALYSPEGCDITIEVKNGAVRIAQSGCRDGICMKTGEIRSSFQSIACLPQRVAIRIENTESNKYDVII